MYSSLISAERYYRFLGVFNATNVQRGQSKPPVKSSFASSYTCSFAPSQI